MEAKKNRNRTSKGRQKISITKIEEKSNLQVTFSKRRTGLIKKAGELCILSGAEIAILVFSPKDKPYSFAHPNLDSVLNRFLNEEKEDQAPRGYNDDDTSADPRFKIFNDEYEAALRDLEKEKKKKSCRNSKRVRDGHVINGGGFWWDSVNEGAMTSLEEIEEYASALEELHGKVQRRIRQQMIDAWTTVATAGFGGGGNGGGGGSWMMGMDNNWFGGDYQGQGVVYGFGDESNNWQYV